MLKTISDFISSNKISSSSVFKNLSLSLFCLNFVTPRQGFIIFILLSFIALIVLFAFCFFIKEFLVTNFIFLLPKGVSRCVLYFDFCHLLDTIFGKISCFLI
jgi:hypothetical protein